MAAYLIGHITVHNPEKWKAYVAGVGSTLAPFGGEVVFRGRKTSVLAGEHPHELAVVLRFPDEASLRQWYRSLAYQALIPNRDAAADLVLVGYQEIA